MERGRLSRNIVSAVGQNLIQTLVLLVIYRYLLDTIGLKQFGIWSLALASASLAQIGSLGLAVGVTKFIAQYRARDDREAVSLILQTALLSVAAFLGVLLLLAYPATRWGLTYFVPADAVPDARSVLPWAFTSFWIGSVAEILLSAFDGVFRVDLRGGIVIVANLVYLAGAIVLGKTNGLIGLAWAQNLQSITVLVLSWQGLRRVIAGVPLVPRQWSGAHFREMYRYGLNVQLNSVAAILFEPTAKALVSRFGGLAMVGYFEIALRAVMRLRALLVEANRVLVPLFAAFDSEDRDGRVRLYGQNLRVLFFVATPAFALIFAVAPQLAELWLGGFRPMFVLILMAMVATWYLNVMASPAYFAYLGSGRLRWITLAHATLGGVNVLAGLALGEAFGRVGVLAGFFAAVVLGSLVPITAYHAEHGIRLRDVLRRSDLALFAACGVVAVAGAALFAFDLGRGPASALRLALPMVLASAALLTASALHPFGRDIIGRCARRRAPAAHAGSEEGVAGGRGKSTSE